MLRTFEKLDVVVEIIMHNTTILLGKELHTLCECIESDPYLMVT